MYFVYYLQDPRNPKKGYIGKTCDLKRRLSLHYNPYALKDKTIKNNWIKKLKKLDLKPLVKILIKVKTNKEANKQEKIFIKRFKSKGYILVNGTPGGDGWAKGFKMPKTKARLNGPKSIMRKVILRNIKTGKEKLFKSVRSAAIFAGIYFQHAHLALTYKNRCLTAGGFYWRYAEEKFVPPRENKWIKAVIGINLITKEKVYYKPLYNCRFDEFNPRCVVAVCKGKRKHHKGWVFKYV